MLSIRILFLIFIFSNCNARPKTFEKIGSAVRSLRLTYDVAWSPKQPYSLLESGQMHENGNTYKIQLPDSKVTWLRISSTNQDNQMRFPYLRNTRGPETKTLYFQEKKLRASLQILPLESKIYLRWEAVYHGFLLVFETEVEKSVNQNLEELGKEVHQWIYSSLELF